MTIALGEPFASAWRKAQAFDEVRRLLDRATSGDVVRAKEGRKTIRFEHRGRRYYLKYHGGIGWGEMAKCWLQLKRPVTGAANEWHAIRRLRELDVDTLTPVAFGERGANPARRESFLITEELTGIVSLAQYTERWPEQPPTFIEKRRLIEKVADIARRLHTEGINHRDFYLCHFLLKLDWDRRAEPVLHVVDLHRAQCRSTVPERWLVKDIAGLYFSSMDIGLHRNDIYRFLHRYFDAPLKTVFKEQDEFLQAVIRKARHIYRRDFKRPAPDLMQRQAHGGQRQ